MFTLFNELDALLDLPYPAFEKKLVKLEEEFKNIAISDISEEEVESYFLRIREEYHNATGDRAKNRLAVIGYISHFDSLVEKYFPDYIILFQNTFEREDGSDIEDINYIFLEHLDEILREYTHRLSEPDQYPSYTGYIQELIQNSMIDLFFWLQDREIEEEKKVKAEDRNTDILIKASIDTKNTPLKFTRRCLELLVSGVLEKIFFEHDYQIRVSPVDPELQLIGRYERKQEKK